MDALRKSLDSISASKKPAAGFTDAGGEEAEKSVGPSRGAWGWGLGTRDCYENSFGSRRAVASRRRRRGPAAAQTRGVTAEDYFAFETLSDPHFSPDGSTIAFVVTTVDQKQNRRRSEIWSVPADGSREAIGVDDGAAVVEQPAVESGRQGDRVPLGAADARRRGDRHRRARRSGCCRSAAANRGVSAAC